VAEDAEYKTRTVSSITKRRAIATALSRQPKSVRITSGQRETIVGSAKKV